MLLLALVFIILEECSAALCISSTVRAGRGQCGGQDVGAATLLPPLSCISLSAPPPQVCWGTYMCVPSCTNMVLQSGQFAGLQVFQPLPFVQVCPLHVAFSARIGDRKSPNSFPTLCHGPSQRQTNLLHCWLYSRVQLGYTVLREVVGVSLPQGFPAGTLSAKTMLFFRLESDVSLLKGRASVLGRFSARWYGMSSPLLQCATGISVLL